MYAKYFKRAIGFVISLLSLTILSPLFLILMVLGAIFMRGNPFFTQTRPGRNEKLFKLIKFRSMSNAKDKNGELLPDDIRLNKYGRFLRSTSLDELPELINIVKGDMAIVGPRPLLVEYLPFYTDEEAHRHDVRPGLTGYAQVNGRNVTVWDVRLQQDLDYIEKCSFAFDLRIVWQTFVKTAKQEDILVGEQHGEGHGKLDKVRHYIPQRRYLFNGESVEKYMPKKPAASDTNEV
ncbi:MAG: sugar transferase [Clostridia bacterium]|nr:sugar transferase [Clostridia bacterium]